MREESAVSARGTRPAEHAPGDARGSDLKEPGGEESWRAIPVAAATALGTGIALLMGGALVHGLTVGNLVVEVDLLLALAWGRVTMIEAYAGFALFAAWIWHREPRAWIAAAWIAALCVLGNLVAGCYLALAARGCRGRASWFWLGPRRAGDDAP